MKIAFFVGEFPVLSETFVLNQVIGLIESRHEVHIYAKEPNNEAKVHLDVEKYNLYEKIYHYPQGSNTLQYDIIHCHFGPYGLEALKFLEIGAIQGSLITTFYGFDASLYPKKFGQHIYDKLFQTGKIFIGISRFIVNQLLSLGCPMNKIVKLPIGINLSKYRFQTRILKNNETVKILTVARLVEKKGIEYSIRAFSKALEKYPNLQYKIIGDGYLRESLENLILELELSGKVQLLGWMTQEEILKFYADSHIFILASVTASNGDREGQGLVLQEAQATGLPVISTVHNGIPDGILDGRSGFLVPEKNVNAMAGKLCYLIENPEIWKTMGLAGRTFVESQYDRNHLNNQLIEIYKTVLN